MNTNIGRTVVSGAYGAGEVIGETGNTLTLRLLRSNVEVTVNKAGNLHYVGFSARGVGRHDPEVRISDAEYEQ